MTRLPLFALSILAVISLPASGDPLPPDATYRPLPTAPLDAVIKSDQAAKGVEVGEGQARPRPAEAGAAPIAIAIVPPTRPRTTTALTRRTKGFEATDSLLK